MSDDYKPVLRGGSDPLVFFGIGQAGGGISKGHVMATVMSHALRDGEVVVVGANSLLPVATARLAQLTHAPNLTIVAGASGGVNPLVEPLVPSSGDYANLIAEAVLSFPEVIALQTGGCADVFFAGGLQIDKHGNCNLATIRRGGTMLRGPGSAGLPWASRSARTLLYATSHTRRLFVESVDFVSLPGWQLPGHEANSASARGPELVVTPLAVLGFSESEEVRLVSVHPGVPVEQVVANTGFELVIPEGGVPTTVEPTSDEMAIMRGFDVDGLLGIVVEGEA